MSMLGGVSVLGIGGEGEGAVWRHDAGMTVFAPFSAESDYFATDQPFMLNPRVSDLDDLVASLSAAGVPVQTRPEWETEYGRFVRIVDPEGLEIELWEAPE